MVDDKLKKMAGNQSGQALFELIIFLPFLIFLYTIYSTAGNSISASINQQKAVRGYFYSLLMGNSYINTLTDLEVYSSQSEIKMVGFSAVGWREKSDAGGRTAYAPCFRFSSLLKRSDSSEECETPERDSDSQGNTISPFIRVFTFYGVCGPVYSESTTPDGQTFYHMNPAAQTDPYKCALANSPLN